MMCCSRIGDEQDFAALFDEYKNLVYKTAYLQLGGAHEAEDALQEVFVKVYESLDSYDPEKGAFTTWLHRITINQCLNRRRKRHPLSIPPDRIPWLTSHTSSPESWTQMSEEIETVRQAVSRLSDKQRAVVILRYYRELSYAEIADILDIPLGTVKSRLNLAHRTLRKELEVGETSVKARFSQWEV